MKGTYSSSRYLPAIFLSLVFALAFHATESFARTCENIFSGRRPTVASKYFDSYKALKEGELEETIGVEVEAIVPFSVGARGVAEAIANELEKSGLTVQKSFRYETLAWKNKTEVYKIQYTLNGSEYSYVVKQDYSVMAGAGYLPLEIVSPILRNQGDYKVHLQLIESLTALGVRPEPNTAGVHIHVGMKDVTVGELGLLGYVFQMVEADLAKRFMVAQTRLPFIRPTDPVLQEIFASNGTLGTTVPDFLKANFNGPLARRHALNLLSLVKFSTVEFRLFNSTLDPVVLDFERRFATGLVKAIRTKNSSFMEWVFKLERGDAKFEELLEGIGITNQEWIDVQRRIRIESDALVKGKSSLLLRELISAPASLYKGYAEPYFFKRGRSQ